MKLFHKRDGSEVKIGDAVRDRQGYTMYVSGLPGDGKVNVIPDPDYPPLHGQSYHCDVFDLESR